MSVAEPSRSNAVSPRADQRTADAFARSWNNLPAGSIYTADQFEDWMEPLRRDDIQGKDVLELGCGNGSLLLHLTSWSPSFLEGVELGDCVSSATANMRRTGFDRWRVSRADLTTFGSSGYDVVLCIGVLHHLEEPERGLEAVVRNVRPGGRFHCWVYAREGNDVIIAFIDPLRRLASRLPWWVTNYLIATPLAVPFYLYAKLVRLLAGPRTIQRLPLGLYSRWIARRGFRFFRHVALDQLVAPHTRYIDRKTIERWLASYREIDPASTYVIMRNGNSWKFGGRIV